MTTQRSRIGAVQRGIGFVIRILAFFSLLLLPHLYLHLDHAQQVVDRLLHVKVDPIYSGGSIMASFVDRPGDDKGEGGLTYPLHASFFPSGCLDLLRYNVHVPVTDARLDDPADFWQLDVTLSKINNAAGAPHGFSQPVIHIYLDVDGCAGGSTETADPRCELVRFSPDHPWDFFIHVDGLYGGTITSADRSYKEKVHVLTLENRNAIHLRLPFDHPGLMAMLDGRPTYHYVLVGASDPLAVGGFMKVDKESGMRCGGGARSVLTPRVYDYLEPRGSDQKKSLSSYRESSYDLALLEPLEVHEKPASADENMDVLLEKFRAEARQEAKKQNSNDGQREIRRLERAHANGSELLPAYFAAGLMNEAERLAREILGKNPADPIALAHLASLTAMKAQRAASLSQACDYVYQSLEWMRKASENCHDDNQRLTVLLHRANVEMAVPDSVFHTSADAGRHLIEAADILERQRPKKEKMIADCILKAASAYEAAGENGNADSCWIHLSALPNLPAAVKVKLLERGYRPDGT